jgi:hypothetical protein
VLYLYVCEDTYNQITQKTGLSGCTTSEWLKYCRQLVTQVVIENKEGVTVGSEGTTVQIHKSKFGKRKKTKNGRGHRVEGAWVFGGVEVGGGDWGNNKYFLL